MLRPRLYEEILRDHFARNRQMAFVTGPRQAGKTTLAVELAGAKRLLNFDSLEHRRLFLEGGQAVAERLGLNVLAERRAVIAFDELHKVRGWKRMLKGFFDVYADRASVIVTGSSRLDLFQKGGDSLMGRYFLFHLHPFSAGELLRTKIPDALTHSPEALAEEEWRVLWDHGGYPEPFLKRDSRFTRRWQRLRRQQLFREDVRDLTRVQEVAQLEVFGLLLAERSGQQLIYSNLAADARVSVDTARRWVETLRSLHFGFLVRPWFKNVSKALRKEPKWYLRDWSEVQEPGPRAETFVACHLLKAVDAWNDLGLGAFELRYARDKQQREVDFVIVRDRKPWLLIEVKQTETKIPPSLSYFQRELNAPHALLVVMELPYVQADCFSSRVPVAVPARTFLSQLL